MFEKGERSLNNEEYNAIIYGYVEITRDTIAAMTNGYITLSINDLITIEFLIRRFNMSIVESALNTIGVIKQEDFIPELRRLCAEKFIEVYGVK